MARKRKDATTTEPTAPEGSTEAPPAPEAQAEPAPSAETADALVEGGEQQAPASAVGEAAPPAEPSTPAMAADAADEPDTELQRLRRRVAELESREAAVQELAEKAVQAHGEYLEAKESAAALKKRWETLVEELQKAVRDRESTLFDSVNYSEGRAATAGDAEDRVEGSEPAEAAPDTSAGSENAPAADPEAWRGVILAELVPHGAPQRALDALDARNITTLGALSELMSYGSGWHKRMEVKGIGDVGADAVERALQAWFIAHPEKCPPRKPATPSGRSDQTLEDRELMGLISASVSDVMDAHVQTLHPEKPNCLATVRDWLELLKESGHKKMRGWLIKRGALEGQVDQAFTRIESLVQQLVQQDHSATDADEPAMDEPAPATEGEEGEEAEELATDAS